MGDESTKKPGDAMLRLIGAGKLVKAVLFLLLGLALLRVLGNESRSEAIIDWVDQLRPGKLTHLVDVVLRKVLSLPVGRRFVLVGGAFAYAAVFATEGTGLLLRKRWAEWLTVVSTGLLIPFEIYEIAIRPDAIRIGAFTLNAAVLVYLIVRIRRDQRTKRAGRDGK